MQKLLQYGFLIFWLGIGALLAMAVSFITDNVVIQMAVFVISSTALIFLTKPLVNKYINKDEVLPTNANRLIDKKGIVIKDIGTDVGQVKVDGEVWSAVSENELTLSKGTEIRVLKIDGVKLVVTSI